MSSFASILRANPGLVAVAMCLGFPSMLALLGLVLRVAGASLRPLVFLAGLMMPLALLFLVAALVNSRAHALRRAMAAVGFWKATGCSLGLVLGLAALVTLLFYLLADIPPRLGGHELRLEVEIKLPAGQAKPKGKGAFTLGSVINQRQRAAQPGDLHLDQARRENDRWIVPAEVLLFTTPGRRMILAEVAETNQPARSLTVGSGGIGTGGWSRRWGPGGV